eukprot:scaffold37042_cov32-Tisochrysis_lutea.AAC.1
MPNTSEARIAESIEATLGTGVRCEIRVTRVPAGQERLHAPNTHSTHQTEGTPLSSAGPSVTYCGACVLCPDLRVYSSKQQYFDVKYPGESTAMKALLPFTPSLMPVNDLFSAYYLGGAGKCRCQQVSQKDSASASKCG